MVSVSTTDIKNGFSIVTTNIFFSSVKLKLKLDQSTFWSPVGNSAKSGDSAA
jgi:hypothetical protein